MSDQLYVPLENLIKKFSYDKYFSMKTMIELCMLAVIRVKKQVYSDEYERISEEEEAKEYLSRFISRLGMTKKQQDDDYNNTIGED